MRSSRLTLLFLAIYFVFLGGSAYYNLFFVVRVFHHLFVTLLLAVWLIRRIRKGQGLPLTSLNLALYAAVILWLISAAASLDPRMAFEHAWFPIIHVLFFLFLAEFIRRGRQRLMMEILFFIAALVVFITGIELASWYFGLGILPGTQIGWADVIGPGAWLPIRPLRASLAMNISTLLAGFVAPLVTITGVWAFTADQRYKRVLWLLTLALMLILVLTQSRGGLLSLLAALAVLTTFRIIQSTRITRFIPIPILISGAAVIGIAAAAFLVIYSTNPSRQAGDEGRLDMWSSAVRMVGDYPILGVGTGLFGRALRNYREAEYVQDKLVSAHNIYLNTAAETGIVGVIVGTVLLLMFVQAWWRNWRAASQGRKLRLEGAFAALIGLSVHSLVDAFTITPIVLLIALLAAYCVIQPREGFEAIPTTPRFMSITALILVLVYGAWFAYIDFAQNLYQRSLEADIAALESVSDAQALDPELNLYPLHMAYLQGIHFPDQTLTLERYQQALALEPSWDIGWMNLAALAERQGDTANAMIYLNNARQINRQTSASLHWARMAEAENAASHDEIVASYVDYLTYHPRTALSDFWAKTQIRRNALNQYLQEQPIDVQYRVWSVHDPQQANALVPTTPITAEDWWVVGQHALTVQSNKTIALDAFNHAIEQQPEVGDFYVSRAQAQQDINAALRDLDIATILNTVYTHPNTIRAELSVDPVTANTWRAAALPPRVITQEFAGTMFGRPAIFDLPPQMRDLGPGYEAMQPWYDLAQTYLDAGDTEGAANVYRAIIDYAPDEQEARARLSELES